MHDEQAVEMTNKGILRRMRWRRSGVFEPKKILVWTQKNWTSTGRFYGGPFHRPSFAYHQKRILLESHKRGQDSERYWVFIRGALHTAGLKGCRPTAASRWKCQLTRQQHVESASVKGSRACDTNLPSPLSWLEDLCKRNEHSKN